MKPDKIGIWEWFDKDGVKRLVQVVDVGFPDSPYLRVYFWGGYYNVHGDPFDGPDAQDEWPNRWGNYVGELYEQPTDRQRAEIFKSLQK